VIKERVSVLPVMKTTDQEIIDTFFPVVRTMKTRSMTTTEEVAKKRHKRWAPCWDPETVRFEGNTAVDRFGLIYPVYYPYIKSYLKKRVRTKGAPPFHAKTLQGNFNGFVYYEVKNRVMWDKYGPVEYLKEAEDLLTEC
jgi:hypothetical protein